MKKKKLNAEKAKLSSPLSNIQGLFKACATTPSIVDEVLSVGFDNVLKYWLSDLKENGFEIEHKIKFPIKTIAGINYKEVTTFVANFIEAYHSEGDESGFNTL